jgi:hypothetical protein
VVRTSALVTRSSTVGCDTIATSVPTTSGEASRTTSSNGRACACACAGWVRAVAGDMSHLTAGVASAASGTSADAEGRTIRLDVAESLTMIALLSCSYVRAGQESMRIQNLTFGGTRERTLIGLVTGLLAVVAESFRGSAHFSVVADIAAFVAGATRKRRHLLEWCIG